MAIVGTNMAALSFGRRSPHCLATCLPDVLRQIEKSRGEIRSPLLGGRQKSVGAAAERLRGQLGDPPKRIGGAPSRPMQAECIGELADDLPSPRRTTSWTACTTPPPAGPAWRGADSPWRSRCTSSRAFARWPIAEMPSDESPRSRRPEPRGRCVGQERNPAPSRRGMPTRQRWRLSEAGPCETPARFPPRAPPGTTRLPQLENRHVLPGSLQHSSHRCRKRAKHGPEHHGERPAGRGAAGRRTGRVQVGNDPRGEAASRGE